MRGGCLILNGFSGHAAAVGSSLISIGRFDRSRPISSKLQHVLSCGAHTVFSTTRSARGKATIASGVANLMLRTERKRLQGALQRCGISDVEGAPTMGNGE